MFYMSQESVVPMCVFGFHELNYNPGTEPNASLIAVGQYRKFQYCLVMSYTMKKRSVSVSLVIPAYNEEAHLRACLDAVAAQTVRPYEVIVVDNNSTDKTAEIARSYPFVTVISEKKQGPVHARNAGFSAAKGEIIGRIDVDSHIAPDWIERVQQIFSDPAIDAVSGSLDFHDMPFHRFFRHMDLFLRRYLARNLGREGELFLYGGNMALRSQLWHEIKEELCEHRHLHEDIDLAAHLAGTDYSVAFDETLRADVSARRIDSDTRSFFTYVLANPRTYALHGLASRRYMYPVAWTVLACYLPLKLLYRAYDQEQHKMSLAHFIRPAVHARVSPVSDNL